MVSLFQNDSGLLGSTVMVEGEAGNALLMGLADNALNGVS